ncbi:hypothetical protein [Hydrogenophaga atypica]|uniref:MBG domain-containing protein n=1 Tax=Hydrogenophaga atypica TaxID=249409 RepID=A0ABW2QGZ9_9BURK
MAISYVGGKGAGAAGQGGGSISLTTGLTGGSGGAPIEGDLVVVTVSVGTAARAPTVAISTPSGYTPLTPQRTTATTYDTNVQTCYKVMGSTPDTAVTIPPSGNNADGIAYTIQVFRGVDPTTPMDVSPTYATGSGVNNRPDPAAIEPVTEGAWIVCCGGGASATGTTLYTAGYLTNLLTFNGADTNDGTVGAGYYTGWTSGSYNPAAFGGGSVNAANSWGATTLALRPQALSAVGQDSPGGYDILASADADSTGSYAISSIVGAESAGSYAVLNAVGANAVGTYALRQAVGQAQAGGYSVLAVVAASLPGAYGLGGVAGASFAGAYGLAGTVGAEHSGGFAVLTPVGAELAGAAQVLTAVGTNLSGAYALAEAGSAVGADLPGSYQLRSPAAAELSGGYLIDSLLRRAPAGAGHSRTGAATQRPVQENTARVLVGRAGQARAPATPTTRKNTRYEPQANRRPSR